MLQNIFQNTTQQVLTKYNAKIQQINNIGDEFKSFTDLQLQEKTTELQKKIRAGTPLESITPEAFALIREASDRVLGLRHFEVQLIGGLILTEGKIAEMKTGEGKTLVALLPVFLNALTGKGAHVITVNDYLARRDAESVGQVYRYLGLTVGLIQENMEPTERKENYKCDVVYVTNNELGFDYLRDNMALSEEEIVQRQFNYCVIDEVDSILIDEARTPLIISGASEAPTQKYKQTAQLVLNLTADIHYKVDEKNQNVTLKAEGVSFCEQALGIADLYNPQEPWIAYILNSIKAKELFQKNKNYIINEESEIIIVDEFTGRTMVGRRWSDGLHQAVEAKENVPIQDESQTLASISYQNLFLLYEKLSGMTGTAKTEEAEFENIYNLKVVEIPTNKPIKRKDFSDLIYKNQYIKWRAIAQECLEMFEIGRPVLVGTTTIEKSELLAALLSEYNLPYRLLNARPENVESESEIVAQAGCKKSITIATNMAGRGTDILLGGNPGFVTTRLLKEVFEKNIDSSTNSTIQQFLDKQPDSVIDELKKNHSTLCKQPISELKKQADTVVSSYVNLYETVLNEQRQNIGKDATDVLNFGGLHVIGTERHESRRIDNQLRGRSGRQGDPGSSRFFLCLEDKLLRIFGGDNILNVMENLGFEDGTPIQSSLLNKSLESAQQKVEAFYYETRKQLFEYDQALNTQRNNVYGERRRIFEKSSVRGWITEYADRCLTDILISVTDQPSQTLLIKKLENLLGLSFSINNNYSTKNPDEKLAYLQQQIQISYDLKEMEMEILEQGLLRELEKNFILQQIDFSWMEHLEKITFLRDSIRWRAYGQKDPLTEYKKEAFNCFAIMLARIRHRVVYFVLRSKLILS
jgi:preprotein translocase subunit SecA